MRFLANRAVLAAFAFSLAFFTGTFPPFANPNELSRFEAVHAAVEDGTFRIDRAIALLGDHEDKSAANGHFYSNKAPGLALAAIPVYRALRVVFPPPRRASDAVFVWLRLLTVSALTLIALARLLRRLAAFPAGPLVGFAAAFGTPLLFYARSFFAHAWVAALLFLAWDLAARARDLEGTQRVAALFAGAGFLAGWAAISEYTVAPLVLVLLLSCGAGRRAAAFAAGAALPLMALFWYDAVCFGSPFVLSSAREAFPRYAALPGLFGFRWPSLSVAAGYLFHPSRGLLLFSPFWIFLPAALAAWAGRDPDHRDGRWIAIAIAGFFVLLTGYENWHGGWSLGDRYLLPLVFFGAVALPRALATPLARGAFAVAALFAVVGHLLLTASWPHFPLDLPWPPATGSLWFLSRGWFAPNLAGALGELSLLLPAAAAAAAGGLALRAAAPLVPSSGAALVAALLLLAATLASRPRAPYGAALWRAAVFGAYSGLDPGRTELARVVREAATPLERRQAAGAWRLYGPRPTAP